jgi:hypothetical protein
MLGNFLRGATAVVEALMVGDETHSTVKLFGDQLSATGPSQTNQHFSAATRPNRARKFFLHWRTWFFGGHRPIADRVA